MDLKYLTDVHTGRYAERVKNDVKRTTVRKERHILYRKYAGNYTLVTVTTGHLVTYGDLTFLSDVDSYGLVYARSKLIAIFSCKYLSPDCVPLTGSVPATALCGTGYPHTEEQVNYENRNFI